MSDKLKLWDLQNYIVSIKGSYFFEQKFKMSKGILLPRFLRSTKTCFAQGHKTPLVKQNAVTGFFFLFMPIFILTVFLRKLSTHEAKQAVTSFVRKPKTLDEI